VIGDTRDVHRRPTLTQGIILIMLATSTFAPATARAESNRPATVGTAAAADSVDLAPLRELWLASVKDDRAVARALDEVERIRARAEPAAGSALGATLAAYEGALATLRARHAAWPPAKLRHLREGLAVLDRTVEAHPEHAEVRYLRLMSCYYLPGIFGRGGSVRADFAALARLLPGVRGEYPPAVHAAITRFVVERGRLAPEQRRALEDALPAPDA